MTAPNRHTASTLALAVVLCLGGALSVIPTARADIAPPGHGDTRDAPSPLDTLSSRLEADTPEAALTLLRDLSASPGAERAAGLVAWTEDRIDLWRAALTAGQPDAARRHSRETLAALESLLGLQGSIDLGLSQLTVLFNGVGEPTLIDPDANAVLGALAALLQSQGTRVQITGYATPGERETGSTDLLQTANLAMERARFVAWRLRDLGVPVGRMVLSGQVDQSATLMPIPGDPLSNPLGRRVEILVEDQPVASVPPPTVEGAPLVAKIPVSLEQEPTVFP
ncbi:MAG: hypothetical protein K9H25_16025 [Rhodospirillum sp.]|nr:hypothetical protein [Rhodospirillum sp.]MCF8490928.1 hypothetical protein [Rhodospirillum sp.]MCF8499069.1 hypothetical protein [Rhodospirillum sp.]